MPKQSVKKQIVQKHLDQAPPREEKKAPVEHRIRITNAGPVSEFAFTTKPGWNEVRAANDRGKTRAVMLPLARISDPDMPFPLKRGAAVGTLEVDGLLLHTERAHAKHGDVEAKIMNRSPIAGVIIPGFEDEKTNEKRRTESFVKLVAIQATGPNLAALVNHDEEVVDGIIAEHAKEMERTGIIEAKEWLRGTLNEQGLKLEKEADQLAGEIRATQKPQPAQLSKLSVADAQEQYESAVATRQQYAGEAAQRKRHEAKQEEIRATLGERPDPKEFETAIVGLRGRHAALIQRDRELTQQLEAVRAEIKSVGDTMANADDMLQRTRQAANEWDRRKEILDTDVEGASDEDVVWADDKVTSARAALESARATEEFNHASAVTESARQRHAEVTKRAAKFRALAKGTTAALAKLLEQASVPGISVNERGYLCLTKDNDEVESFLDVNYAARARAACKAWARGGSLSGRIIAFPADVYEKLDANARKEIGDVWNEFGVHACVEVPVADAELEVVHVA